MELEIARISPKNDKSKNGHLCNNFETKFILNEAETALHFLEERRDFWSQQKPEYQRGNARKIEKSQNWDNVSTRMARKKPSVFI